MGNLKKNSNNINNNYYYYYNNIKRCNSYIATSNNIIITSIMKTSFNKLDSEYRMATAKPPSFLEFTFRTIGFWCNV